MFTDDFKDTPYWWEAAPPDPATPTDLPKSADVVIVGSGYTGLHAAVQTARAGKSTLVLEAQAIGHGASTRNGGQISTSVKASEAELIGKYGAGTAAAILKDAQASLDHIGAFIQAEGIDCDYHVHGRFHGAHSAGQYEALAREAGTNLGIKSDTHVVARADQHSEIGTDYYHGGLVFPHHASVHPGKYHKGVLAAARAAGAQVVSHCPVTAIERRPTGCIIATPHGTVQAGKVVVATNGYTTGLTPWQQKRIIPIGSYIIATEDLPSNVMDRLLPTNRVLGDTRKLVFYYRPSPDRKRILFGGRVSLGETDARRTGPRLHAELVRLFPELHATRISHSWTGLVGYTFDTLAHTGRNGAVFHAMGYCGSGVGMASYLGMRIGQQAAGLAEGATGFDKIPFPSRFYFSGNPWFLAPSILFYRLRDRFGF